MSWADWFTTAPAARETDELPCDPVDARQVGLVHRTQTVRNFEHGTHADCLLRRSSTVSATLSRR